MKCQRCGTENSGKFCTVCGSPLVLPKDAQFNNMPPTQNNNRNVNPAQFGRIDMNNTYDHSRQNPNIDYGNRPFNQPVQQNRADNTDDYFASKITEDMPVNQNQSQRNLNPAQFGRIDMNNTYDHSRQNPNIDYGNRPFNQPVQQNRADNTDDYFASKITEDMPVNQNQSQRNANPAQFGRIDNYNGQNSQPNSVPPVQLNRVNYSAQQRQRLSEERFVQKKITGEPLKYDKYSNKY
ncbi:MAG: hypothetical protein MJ089_06340, partial [Ruminococcus sp.]|nr:hypothetical protein [Ruminococcus sp.]